MAKTREIRPQDLERELPAANGDAETTAAESAGAAQASPASAAERELARLKEERDLLFDRLARVQAEFDNSRKRNQRDQQEYREYALFEAARSLLPVLDSLDLALKNSRGEQSELHSGVELTRRQLMEALARFGVREVPAAGEPFDPQYHQAIEMVETAATPDHQVLEELQRGYRFKDRLLRPAMVRVARNPRP